MRMQGAQLKARQKTLCNEEGLPPRDNGQVYMLHDQRSTTCERRALGYFLLEHGIVSEI